MASRNLLKGCYLVDDLEFQSSSICPRIWLRETRPVGIIRFGRGCSRAHFLASVTKRNLNRKIGIK